MNEEFVRGIALAIKRGFLTKEEGKTEIMNMIRSEQNKNNDWIPLLRRIEKIEGFLNI